MNICSQQNEISGVLDSKFFGSSIEFSIDGSGYSTLIDSDGSYVLAPVVLPKGKVVKYRINNKGTYTPWSQDSIITSCSNMSDFQKAPKPTIKTTDIYDNTKNIFVDFSGVNASGYLYLYNGNQFIKSYGVSGSSITITFDAPFETGSVINCTLVRPNFIQSEKSNSVVVKKHQNLNPKYSNFNNSDMSDFFDITDADYLGWAETVKDKLVEQGIIPNYVPRVDDNGVVNEDYKDFWIAVTKFFGYYAQMAKELSDFTQIKPLLIDYLTQKNLFINEYDSIGDIQSLQKTIFSKFAERGTYQIFDKEEGEFLKAICFQIFDHFFYLSFKEYEWGWCLGKSSPLYRGISSQRYNLFYSENTPKKRFFKYLNKNNIPHIDPITLNQKTDSTTITVGAGGVLGNTSLPSARIPISENQSYIFSCFIKAPIYANIEIGCKAFMLNGVEVNFGLSNESLITSYTNYKVINDTVIYKLDTYLKSYNRSDTVITPRTLLIKPNTAFIAPYIKSNDSNIEVYNVEIKPVKTFVSTGFIQTKDVLGLWFKNKSKTPTLELIYKLKNYIFSYKTTLYYEEDGINSMLLDALDDATKKNVLQVNKYFPKWTSSNKTIKKDGKEYKQVYDANDPTKTKLVLVAINQKVYNCTNNQLFEETVETTSCLNPFVNKNKKYSKRYKQTYRDQNCNIISQSVYVYKDENQCNVCVGRNTQPIWVSTGKIMKKICETTEVIYQDLNLPLEETHLFDLEFSVIIDPSTLKTGSNFKITYRIKNIGTNRVDNINLKSVIPNQFSLTENNDFTMVNNILSATKSLNPSASVDIVVNAKVLYGTNININLKSDLYFSDGVTSDLLSKYNDKTTIKIS